MIKKLWPFLKPFRKHCIFGPLAKFTEAVLELFLPLIMARVIDHGIVGGDRVYVYRWGAVMLGIVAGGYGLALICQYVASLASQGFGARLRSAVFAHILSLSLAQTEKFGVSTMINRVTEDIRQIEFGLAMMIRLAVRAPFLSIGSMVMAMTINFRLSLIIIASVPLMIVMIWGMMRAILPLQRLAQRRMDAITRIVRENLSGVRVIRAFVREGQETERFSKTVTRHTNAAMMAGRLSALINPATALVVNLSVAAILWAGDFQIQAGGMTPGELVAFIGYVNQNLLAVTVLTQMMPWFTRAYAGGGRVVELLDTKPLITDYAGENETGDQKDDSCKSDRDNVNNINSDESLNPEKNSPAVAFSHVYFGYGNAEPVLEDVSFSIKAGSVTGIVGGTGAGKSTLIRLLLRLYDVTGGTVLVEGTDVKRYRLEQLRERIGYVPQRVELFAGAVAENIRWGKEEATDDEVEQAVRAAQADRFIRRMPDSYNTVLEHGGMNLSGGQRQRIAIARALVRRPSILVLDDTASALDYVTDNALRDALRSLPWQVTVLIISQRIKAVTHADDILVLDEGRLIARGKHEELLENCEIYRQTWELNTENE
ncbi:MAG: ABC transporter ATP-binding protein/permease [Oscillospiraceae bacterium]|nr:ABC transporter ATP-binding protein/permease [Oscillospiraceae bacterium]